MSWKDIVKQDSKVWYFELLSHMMKLNTTYGEQLDILQDLRAIAKRNPNDVELDNAIEDILILQDESFDASDRLFQLVKMREKLQ